ncbi:MAG: transcription-repair coupling factor [Chlamydiota bacterium]
MTLFPDSPSSVLQALDLPSNICLEELTGSSKSLLLSALAKKRPILLITTKKDEEELFSDLSFFLKRAPLLFPAWDTLIGENIPPNADIVGRRMETFYKILTAKEPPVVIAELPSALQQVPLLTLSSFSLWKKGTPFSWNKVPEFLESLGYYPSPVVSDKKQFAMRRGILDLFPISATDPYRIEFFGDTIDTIRTFDPIHQRSIEKKSSLFLAPTEERFLLERLGASPLWEQFPQKPLIVLDDLTSLEDLYVKLQTMPGFSSPFLQNISTFFQNTGKNQRLYLVKEKLSRLSPCQEVDGVTHFSMFEEKLSAKCVAHEFYPISVEILDDPGPFSLHFLYEKPRYKDSLVALLQEKSISQFTLIEGYLSEGFLYKGSAFFAEKDITHKKKVSRQKWRSAHHAPISDMHTLEPGDLVVHFHSGIGKYLGTEKQKNHLGLEAEFLVVEYAKKSKLYVPIAQAHLVSKYIGSSERAPILTDLGSKKWHQAKIKVQKEIMGYASDLLHLYAERQLEEATVHEPDSRLMQEFEEDFPYEETPDQRLAIDAIKQDLQTPKPMDRLISGDVGYGKTEVAMRAAFKAVVDGNGQVALLVPTTVLATQHYDTFVERMGDYPVRIGILSRFHTTKQNRKTLEDLASGEIDIIIGTHRLLSKDVLFPRLTLLIIDEEQRFGVRAKERLKARKRSIHSLALSATPIPRTLYMSLVGARDISVIATPPQNRLPIKTVLAETDDTLIQNALLRELAREGQAFFIHNRVESISARAKKIGELVPSAKIGIAHGQMPPAEVEKVFHEFREGLIDVLFATVIVENGIDVPSANTIIIDNAHTYGISDLYQLRGRVGRWKRSAYAYLLLPKNRSLQEPAQKRLQALLETSGYGGGMKLAMRDLEIRGAGDILGTQQSGQVASIGFHLYCKLLRKVLRSLKEKKPISFSETKLEFLFPASLPEIYIGEKSLRMEFYHRLGEAHSEQEIEEIAQELEDRFGSLPQEVTFLLHMTKIRLFGTENKFTKIRFFQTTFLAERMLGKTLSKKTFPLPAHIASPKQLESYVKTVLAEEFLQKTLPRHRS